MGHNAEHVRINMQNSASDTQHAQQCIYNLVYSKSKLGHERKLNMLSMRSQQTDPA